MVKYVCFFCGKEMEYDPHMKKIRCKYCGSRVLYKKRPPILKHVKAI